jgi:hypothetical protein
VGITQTNDGGFQSEYYKSTRGGTSPNDGGFQREKSEDPIIGEPIYIHANMVRVRACVYETLLVWPNQPALRLHSGTCEDDVSTSGLPDRFGSRADGTEGALRIWSSPDSLCM